MTENDQVLLELKNGSFELSKLKFKPKVEEKPKKEKVEKPKKEPKEKVEKPKKERVNENKTELSFVNKTKNAIDIEKENKKKKK
jgi:hypothetical protein